LRNREGPNPCGGEASRAHVGAYDGAEGATFPGLRRWAVESRRERGYGRRRERSGDDRANRTEFDGAEGAMFPGLRRWAIE